MHSVMVLALSKRMDGCSTPGELFAVLRLLLKHYVYLQGTQGNQKKVLVTYCMMCAASFCFGCPNLKLIPTSFS